VGRMHWALAVLDSRSKTITYNDSFFDSERSSRVLATLMRWLREYAAMDAAANGGQLAIDVSEWTSVSPGRSVPQQTNLHDCGVYVCYYAERLTRGFDAMDFSASDARNLRDRVAFDLISNAVP
jgi:sentrin-specific protease 1